MSQNVVKISLTLPALERLIGGDSEIEVVLRDQVVKNFFKNHLKPILRTELVEQITSQCRQIVRDEWKSVLDEIKRDPNVVNTDDSLDVKREIRDSIDREIKPYLKQREQEIMKRCDESLQRLVNDSFDKQLSNAIILQVRERVVAILNESFKKAESQ